MRVEDRVYTVEYIDIEDHGYIRDQQTGKVHYVFKVQIITEHVDIVGSQEVWVECAEITRRQSSQAKTIAYLAS